MLASKQLFLSPVTISPPPLLDIDTATRLRVAIGRLSRGLRVTAAASEAGLTPTRISVLLSVDRHGPIRISELAELESLNPTMLSRAISQLVDDATLERVCDDRDRRAAWVNVTAAGHRLAERVRRERTDALNDALSGLDADDRRLLERALPALEGLASQLKDRHS
jgi:DNA-binding MarR family transcriptional regulator